MWSIYLYGAGTCTLWKVDQRKVLKCAAGEGWRRSVGLIRALNEEVLHRAKEEGNNRHTTKEGRLT
jgi:hypothetical protein